MDRLLFLLLLVWEKPEQFNLWFYEKLNREDNIVSDITKHLILTGNNKQEILNLLCMMVARIKSNFRSICLYRPRSIEGTHVNMTDEE